MSCLWFALTCLAAVTMANADLNDFIKTQLSNYKVFKSWYMFFPYSSSIDLSDILVKGENDEMAELKGGTATYKIHSISTVVRPTNMWGRLLYEFFVTGEATCKFKEYIALNKKIGEWTSSSSHNQNRFEVTFDERDCTVSDTSVVSEPMAGIGICAACSKKIPTEMDESMLYRVGDRVIYEVKAKINQALTVAVGSLNLKGSGIVGCK